MQRILATVCLLLIFTLTAVSIETYSADAQTNLIVNGSFSSGMQGWETWDAITYRISSGVFEFYRGGTGASAVVLQKTGQNFAAGTKLKATFRLGTSDSGLRRVTVILHSNDWTDMQVCTFLINASQPLSNYGMEVFTLRAWTNATISFYSSRDYGRGWTRLDDVTLRVDNTLPGNRVSCIDPYRTPGVGGENSPNYISNSQFSNGTNSWSFSGEYVSRVQNGVLEMYTKTGGPAANMFQDLASQYFIETNGGMSELTFQMGNSSANRKRMSVLLHDGFFAHIYFCTFWVNANSGLANYTMRVSPSIHLGNMFMRNIAFYVSPFDNLGWLRLDNITLRERQALWVVGTECYYPTGQDAASAEPFMLPTLQPTASGMPALTMPLPELALPPAETVEESGFAEGSFSE